MEPWRDPLEALLAQVEELHMFDVHRGVLDEEHLRPHRHQKKKGWSFHGEKRVEEMLH